jgi:hypothetical protein
LRSFGDDSFHYPAILGKRMIDITDQIMGNSFQPVVELIAALVIAKFFICTPAEVFTTLPALHN